MATTYDIYYEVIPAEEQVGASGKVVSFGYASALGVKGPRKLANRWLKCFMTLKGSDPLDKTYGTGFPDLFGSNISRRADFTDAMVLFVDDCNQQLISMDNEQFPPDNERLASATITSLTSLGPDGYEVYVTIKNVAGELVTIQVPAGTRR